MRQTVDFTAVQGVQHQHRQCKIIYIIILLGYFQLNAVMLMNFRKNRNSMGRHSILRIFQHFPNFRLYKKAVGSDFLIGISKSIQPDNRCSFLSEKIQIVADEFLGCRGCYIKVNLLLVKGTPYLLCAAVAKGDLYIWSARLALVDEIHILLGRLSIWPEVLISNKQIRIFRIILFSKEVLEIRGLL
ncbi:hypothetical protein D3C80_945700 [compost metagenome]